MKFFNLQFILKKIFFANQNFSAKIIKDLNAISSTIPLSLSNRNVWWRSQKGHQSIIKKLDFDGGTKKILESYGLLLCIRNGFQPEWRFSAEHHWWKNLCFLEKNGVQNLFLKGIWWALEFDRRRVQNKSSDPKNRKT